MVELFSGLLPDGLTDHPAGFSYQLPPLGDTQNAKGARILATWGIHYVRYGHIHYLQMYVISSVRLWPTNDLILFLLTLIVLKETQEIINHFPVFLQINLT